MTLLNIFVAWHSWLFSRSFSVCLPRFSARPSSRCIFYPLAFLSWSSFSSLVLSRLPSSRYFSPLPEEACVVSTTAYTIRSACAKASLRKPWKLDGLIFKFDQVVWPPSGLKSCSLSLELFQFPVRRYLNIWRFWSFWFICRYIEIYWFRKTCFALYCHQSKQTCFNQSWARAKLGFVTVSRAFRLIFPCLAAVAFLFLAFKRCITFYESAVIGQMLCSTVKTPTDITDALW